MDDLFARHDDLGPTKVLQLYEPQVGLKAALVIDNVAAGPSIGGIRMAPDVTLAECARLARAMTFKNAAAGLPHGGGKVVVAADPHMPKADKEQLIRALACALRDIEEYILAPDMGTDEECMAWIKDEVDRVVALPRELGGIPLDEIGATGFGLSHAAEEAVAHCGFELAGATFAVQGFGAVGKHTARYLSGLGAVLVAVADSGGTLHNPQGIDVDKLLAHKAAGRSVVNYPEGERLDPEAIIGVACDIWIPAARPDVIHADNVDRLQAKLVIEGANIPITHDAEETLHRRGVVCVPDFIANAGGVICAALEYQKATEVQALASIEEKIRYNTRQVLERARAEGVTPRTAANEMAMARVRRAMSLRRWNLF